MRVHWIQHAPQEGLGCIAPWLAARGVEVTCSRPWLAEPLPAAPDFDWLLVMGGPMNVYAHDAHPWLVPEKALIRAAIEAGRRVLGICLGAQLVADQLGGGVRGNGEREIGWFPVRLTEAGKRSPLFAGEHEELLVFHWHGDTFALPPGAEHLACSAGCANQAFVWNRHVLGLQFHPEVTAADVRVWTQAWPTRPRRYVQSGEEMLADLPRFGQANGLMLRLLDRFAAH